MVAKQLRKDARECTCKFCYLPYQNFPTDFCKGFQLWFRGWSWSNNMDIVYYMWFCFVLFSGQLTNIGINVLAIEPGTHILEWLKTIQSNLLQNEANKIFLPRDDGSVLNRIILSFCDGRTVSHFPFLYSISCLHLVNKCKCNCYHRAGHFKLVCFQTLSFRLCFDSHLSVEFYHCYSLWKHLGSTKCQDPLNTYLSFMWGICSFRQLLWFLCYQ